MHRARELFRFCEREGFDWVQFIPQMDFLSHATASPGTYAISSVDYADFWRTSFDLWRNDGHPNMSMSYFDNLLLTYAQRPPEVCSMLRECPRHLVLDPGGTVFPRDFFLDASWALDNIRDHALMEAFHSDAYRRYHAMKAELSETCRQCQWLPADAYRGQHRGTGSGLLLFDGSAVSVLCG